MLMPEARKVQTDGPPDGCPDFPSKGREGLFVEFPCGFPCVSPCPLWLRFAPVRPDAASFRLRTRVVNTSDDETLLDFCLRRLECFKHFSNFLFETECAEDATTVHIQRRDRAYRNHRPPAAMVGRTGHCGAGPSGAPAHLQLGRTGHRRGYLPASPTRLLPAAHAQSDSVSCGRNSAPAWPLRSARLRSITF